MKFFKHVFQLIFIIHLLFAHGISHNTSNDNDINNEKDDKRKVWQSDKKNLRLNSKMSTEDNYYDYYYYHDHNQSTVEDKNDKISAPWLVSLRQKFNNKHLCSGSLISHYFIISVAKCIITLDERQLLLFLPPENILAILASENLFIGGGYKYEINDVFIHPEFRETQNSVDNDLVLLRTRMPIVFNNQVYPIALESDCTNNYEELFMVGWNFLPIKNTFRWKMGIQATSLLSLQQEMCAIHQAHTFTEYFALKMNSKQLCTYFTTPIPVFCIEMPGNSIVRVSPTAKISARYHLVAISSKTNSCYIRYPTANTRIAAHIGWISKIMKINEPQIVNMMHS